jgi:hypothetical protein
MFELEDSIEVYREGVNAHNDNIFYYATRYKQNEVLSRNEKLDNLVTELLSMGIDKRQMVFHF